MIYFNEHKGEIRTIGCIRGSHGLTTCSRLEMFTLNVWDVFQLALNSVLFLYSCNILSYINFLFFLCAFVAKRNSSYQEVILSPALI